MVTILQNFVKLACLEVAFPKLGIFGILVCNLQTGPVMSKLHGKNCMVIPFVVPEILGGLEPPLDAIKMPDVINNL